MESKEKSKEKKVKEFKVLPWIIFWIVVFFSLVILGILKVQPSAFFYPSHDENSYNALKEIDGFEEVIIPNGKETLYGWMKINNSKEEKSPLVIMFGGNAQNSSNTCMNFYKNNVFEIFTGYNFLVVDYPEYGLSTGKVSEKSMFEAANKIYEYAENLEYVDNDNIVVLGFSIGTGVASYISSEKNPNGLVLVAPYDCATSLYNNAINIFYGPLKLLMRYKFDSISYAQEIDVSPLIITSTDDEVINYTLSENLATYFKYNPKFLCVNETKHNDYFSNEEVLEIIEEYLSERLK